MIWEWRLEKRTCRQSNRNIKSKKIEQDKMKKVLNSCNDCSKPFSYFLKI